MDLSLSKVLNEIYNSIFVGTFAESVSYISLEYMLIPTVISSKLQIVVNLCMYARHKLVDRLLPLIIIAWFQLNSIFAEEKKNHSPDRFIKSNYCR